jgi:hypothetical protein
MQLLLDVHPVIKRQNHVTALLFTFRHVIPDLPVF